jgi:hypothetical protein
MNPQTYATLYGPWQPSRPRAGRGTTVTAVLAGVLWTLTMASLAWLTLLLGIVAVWMMAAGESVVAFILPFALIYVVYAAVLTACAYAPGVRRLAPAARLLLLGALAAPVPTTLAAWTWFNTGA